MLNTNYDMHMIKLNEKTQQDFLNREWVQRLLDAGVDMSDAKYWIVNCIDSLSGGRKDYITDEIGLLKIEPAWDDKHGTAKRLLKKKPTYTVSELLYKLHEYVYPEINGRKYSGGLRFLKDAPFYFWYYDLFYTDEEGERVTDNEYLYAEAEYPIESLAMLLIQCHKKDIGIKAKDSGDISDK